MNKNTTSAIEPLIEGYQRFLAQDFSAAKISPESQSPKILVIACCDSRIIPAAILNCPPGELFIIRNVANLVPPFANDQGCHSTSAALEYGVLDLGVSDIIVFGHSNCGGIRALIEQNQPGKSDFIDHWIAIAKPAKQKVLQQYPNHSIAEQAHYCELNSILLSLENLLSFPWIKQRVEEGQLSLHGWHFDLGSGIIEAYNQDTASFSQLGA